VSTCGAFSVGVKAAVVGRVGIKVAVVGHDPYRAVDGIQISRQNPPEASSPASLRLPPAASCGIARSAQVPFFNLHKCGRLCVSF
jgi:hypothetical protein